MSFIERIQIQYKSGGYSIKKTEPARALQKKIPYRNIKFSMRSSLKLNTFSPSVYADN